MIDVWAPTVDQRWLIHRYTQPEKDLPLLLQKLQLELRAQPPPRITSRLLVSESRAFPAR